MRLSDISHFFQKAFVQRQVASIMKLRVPECSLRGLSFIRNHKVEEILKASFNNIYGGVQVLVAPSGSGKTTYLRWYANQFIRNGGSVKYFDGELQSRKQFFESFGNERREINLFEVMPKKSMIIIDQIEPQHLSDDTSSLLKHLAFESSRVEGVSVIACTSNKDKAKEILHLNGDKLRMLKGSVSDWRWNQAMIQESISRLPLDRLTAEERAALSQLAIKAGTPSFLSLCADLLSGGEWTSVNWDKLTRIADQYDPQWKDIEMCE